MYELGRADPMRQLWADVSQYLADVVDKRRRGLRGRKTGPGGAGGVELALKVLHGQPCQDSWVTAEHGHQSPFRWHLIQEPFDGGVFPAGLLGRPYLGWPAGWEGRAHWCPAYSGMEEIPWGR